MAWTSIGPFHGVRTARTAVLTIETRCRAYAVRMRPVEAFSHRTAATLHGLPVPWSADPVIEVAVLGGLHGLPRSRGVRGHRTDAATTAVVARGLRVVSPVDTWLQLGAELGSESSS